MKINVLIDLFSLYLLRDRYPGPYTASTRAVSLQMNPIDITSIHVTNSQGHAHIASAYIHNSPAQSSCWKLIAYSTHPSISSYRPKSQAAFYSAVYRYQVTQGNYFQIAQVRVAQNTGQRMQLGHFGCQNEALTFWPPPSCNTCVLT